MVAVGGECRVRIGGLYESGHLVERDVVRHGFGGQGRRHRLELRLERAKRLKIGRPDVAPPWVAEVLRFEDHAGVDQRRAAQPAADQHRQVAVHAHVEQRSPPPDVAVSCIRLCGADGAHQGRGVLTGPDLQAALENAHGE